MKDDALYVNNGELFVILKLLYYCSIVNILVNIFISANFK